MFVCNYIICILHILRILLIGGKKFHMIGIAFHVIDDLCIDILVFFYSFTLILNQ